jgi:hypothetical protein
MRSLLPPTRWASWLAPRRPRPLRRPVIKGWSKLTYKNGQIVKRRSPSGCSYGLRFGAGDRRGVYLALGHERDGWTRPLAETALLVVTAARRIPLAPTTRKRG